MGLSALESEEFRLDYVMTAKDILTPERIAEYPVIIVCKSNRVTAANPAPWFEDTVTEVRPQEFGEYVRNGGGYISLHSGNTSKEDSEMTKLIGNFFKGHPLRCGVDVKITGKHPITEGVKDFHIRDEHYAIEVNCDDSTELFRTTSETGGDQPGGYVREMGDGRLCVLTPGHTVDVFYNEEYLKILKNAIRWCAKKI
jgi:type 1 glutamine amidotransferase